MTKNSKFMTRVNRMPAGTVLERERYGKHGSLRWKGVIKTGNGEEDIGPIHNPDLGTVTQNLLTLKRRREQDEERTN